MKFDQLVEYKMRNIFLEKSYTKSVREPIPRLFYEKSKLNISLVCLSRVLSKYIKTKILTTWFYLI